ncbi:DUF6503 family protein [Sabulilitoribacter arenilitoris]|uniref:DUF6503 family protein n=1 Tax=Wocania arenilitoris TaxID=2044858 RepID=A0AAE3EP04_9FLAO|nr:DUF6503 family protein [Wocania arenilitoris]MCF7567390.1 DUF6503 family protein [Wocania arenilitoris]
MRILITASVLFLFNFLSFSQQISGLDVLDKAIKYHDSQNKWKTFNDTLYVTMESPKNSNRTSKIIINLPKEQFYLKTKRDSIISEYNLNKDKCLISLNGKTNLSNAVLKTHNLSCERANLYKNYYTYLYGLPMKLKDKGTIIHEKVEQKTFKGKPYLVLKATYEASVGKDVWYFYFNPKTYAMEVYQFYKTDHNGSIKKDSGEYILLTDEEIINGIKMPKTRAWYYNKDDGYLGTDILNK